MTPLSLTVTIQTDPSLDEDTAHRAGEAIATRLGGQLATTETDPAAPSRVGWTFSYTGDQSPADLLGELAQAAYLEAAVVRDTFDFRRVRLVELHALTADEVERQLARRVTPDVVGADEFAELCQVSRQRLYRLAELHPDEFPRPIARAVWLRSMAEQYAATRNRAGGRPAKS